MFRVILLAAAVIITVLLPFYEKRLNGVLELLREKMPKNPEVTDDRRDMSDEEDILNNKNKWRMLMIGYCIFILFMIFATVSIVTLNTKLNNISAATADIMDRVAVLETND